MAVLVIPVETPEGKSVWPEKFTEEELRVKRESAQLLYAQEYLLKPSDPFGTQLGLDWLTLYDYERVEADGEFEGCEDFFGVDPSISGKGDFCSICILRKTRAGKLYLVDFIREQAKLDRMVELINRAALIYPPTVVNVEAVAAQALLVQTLSERTVLPVRSYMPRGKKEDRIAMMAQVFFSTGKVKVRGKRSEMEGGVVTDSSMKVFQAEWLSFPRGKNDDTLDSAESAIAAATSSGQAACVAAESMEIGKKGQEGEEEEEELGQPIVGERQRLFDSLWRY